MGVPPMRSRPTPTAASCARRAGCTDLGGALCSVGWAKARKTLRINEVIHAMRAVPTRAALPKKDAWARRVSTASRLEGALRRAFAHPHMGHFESSTLTGLV